MNRHSLLLNFLEQNNFSNYEIKKIAGDASFRHYFRVTKENGENFVIMDAPPEHEDVRPFCSIAELLLKNKLSAPQIFAKDYQNGFLLLEDFGDDSYRKVLEKDESRQYQLYEDAINLLIDLKNVVPPQNLSIYNEELLLREVMLFADWYLPHVAKKPLNDEERKNFKDAWINLFAKLSAPNMLVLRDYHADNLMVLHNKTSIQRVGLLDFQDAVIGVKAYDLVSLLEDARRDVDKDLQEKMLQHYLKNSNCAEEQFLLDYQILSLQRNIKIIGIFSRLAFRDGKQNYLNFLPRIFSYITPRLENKLFKTIKPFLSYA